MFTKNFVKLHKCKKLYENSIDSNAYRNIEGWTDFVISDNIIFSHRNNYYTKKTFTEGMHSHEYYELVIYLSGNIEYISEMQSFKPTEPCAVWFKPYQMHTARLISPCVYDRVVLYFTPDFFTLNDSFTPITEFMNNAQSFAMNLNKSLLSIELAHKIESTLNSNKTYKQLVANALITQLFALLDDQKHPVFTTALSDKISKVKNYIDCEYPSIKSIEQIASHFYVSREHLSRQFKKRFNINISDYIINRRITESLRILKYKSVAETAYSVGFNSLSAFISAFKFQTGYKPLEYKKTT